MCVCVCMCLSLFLPPILSVESLFTFGHCLKNRPEELCDRSPTQPHTELSLVSSIKVTVNRSPN